MMSEASSIPSTCSPRWRLDHKCLDADGHTLSVGFAFFVEKPTDDEIAKRRADLIEGNVWAASIRIVVAENED